MNSTAPKRVVHVVNALRMGGLENGLVNLVNRLPRDRFRHAIICLTDYDDFANRIQRDDVEIFALNKKPGKDPAWYWRMWKLLRQLRPDIVHTRNLATIETQFIAALAGVKGRVHGEHGWDMHDLAGSNKKYLLLRRLLKPFIHHFIPLSQEIEHYLNHRVRVPAGRITRICNGVDTEVFFPAEPERGDQDNPVRIGYIGRMEPVKDPLNLVNAFVQLAQRSEVNTRPIKLVMVGDGSLYPQVQAVLESSGLSDQVDLPGHREDIAHQLRRLDVFVLPSRAEGISNTILEAMASGLPIVATRVGGNEELVEEGVNAHLVPPDNPVALADAIEHYVKDRNASIESGKASRSRAEKYFSINNMVNSYRDVYEQVLS